MEKATVRGVGKVVHESNLRQRDFVCCDLSAVYMDILDSGYPKAS
jgi:hypothetical protein